MRRLSVLNGSAGAHAQKGNTHLTIEPHLIAQTNPALAVGDFFA
jgi:hypothetical protein